MITLITGMPGCGKTASALSLVLAHEFYPGSVVISGVREYSGSGQYFSDSLPSNLELPRTLYLIDEAGLYWPSRTAGKPQPAIVQQLALHRHIGQDWILTCQHPLQLDVAIRRLVGRHLHLAKTNLGFKQYECGECRDSLEFSKEETFNRPSLDKAVFDVYSSTDVITSLQSKSFRMPAKLKWLLIFLVICFLIIVFFGYRFATSHHSVDSLVKSGFHPVASSSLPLSSASSASSSLLASAPNHQSLLPHEPDYPEIAPVPRFISGCVSSSHACICYDSAGQRIDGLSSSKCHDVIASRNPIRYMYPDVPVPSVSSSSVPSSPPVSVPSSSASASSSAPVSVPPSSPPVHSIEWETNVSNI